VRYVFSVPDDLWAVNVDEAQMHQVIHNLVMNAIQAMPKGGTLRVHAENLELRSNRCVPLNDGRYVRIAIRDSGVGMAQEILDKIFDPYFTTKAKGSGLGLATAYSIVKKHGGLMTVKSKLGLGSIFYFYLPAGSGGQELDSAAREPVVPRKNNILVMDDDEMIRDLTKELLESMGLDASFAKDGSEAIAMYEKARQFGRPFEAVIMDLTIPGGMGGKEAIEKLRSLDPEVKAIVSSGYSNDPIMADHAKYGFVGVLPKPYQVDDVAKILKRILPETETMT